VNAGTDVLDATQSLCDKHVDAICLSNSNLTGSTFPTIAQTSVKAKLPVFAFLGSTSKQGAVIVLTRDYFDMGTDSAKIAARVMRGESAAAIPFHQSTTSKLLINLPSANRLGLTIPESLIKSADQVLKE
jgi:putative ABC transport system substrate-binding protein